MGRFTDCAGRTPAEPAPSRVSPAPLLPRPRSQNSTRGVPPCRTPHGPVCWELCPLLNPSAVISVEVFDPLHNEANFPQGLL